jgi:hypothetical protein
VATRRLLLARNMGVDVKTAQSYIDLPCAQLLVRRLPPWHAILGKRLVPLHALCMELAAVGTV